MLTNHAFNSMLKTLEEPPEHVKFILATTDPQKIPVTVLSRCLQFNLKQMPPGHIVGHLENILGQENIEFDVPALRLLAQGAHGSMRDALSLTDQAIAYAAGKVSLDAVQSMLGALDQSYLIRLLDALAQQDGAGLLAVADDMSARSLSYKAALQDLGSMLHQIAIAQIAPTALADDLPERAELLRLSQSFHKEEIQLFYQIAVHGRNEIGLAPDEYAGFSMTLLRMLAFRPASSGSNMQAQTGGGGSNANQILTKSAHSSNAQAAVPPIKMAPVVNPTALPTHHMTSTAAPVEVKKLDSLPSPSPVATAPAMPTTPASVVGAKPMSPAMAALAAARAASSKQGNNAANKTIAPPAVSSVPTVQVEVAATPFEPTSSPGPAPVSVSVQPSSIAPAILVNGTVPTPSYAEGNQMPPPWDDIDFEQAVMPPQAGRHKEVQESDYWREDTEAELPLNVDSMTVELPQSLGSEKSLQEKQVSISQPQVVESVDKNAVDAVASLPKPLQLMPMPEIEWDGHWPNLAASLPVRGVAQQLAQQSELRQCVLNGNAILLKLCVPVQTLLSAGSGEKLIAALNERFGTFGHEIRVDFEIGAVEQTANAQALAERAERQTLAEQAIQNDSFVQTLIREFGATILTGSVRPI